MTQCPDADPSHTAPEPAALDQRRSWVTPRYVQVRAGDAELGPVPNQTDSVFAAS